MERNEFQMETRCRQLNGDIWEEIPVSLVRECELQISVNGKKLSKIVCSPVDMLELIVGRLITEDYICKPAQIMSLQTDERHMPERMTAEILTDGTICEYADAGPAPWNADMIVRLNDYVICEAHLHRRSHSTHSCTLMRDGEILCVKEDIGRHNAIDRAVGWAAENGVKLNECIAFFSGRISKDAVRKAAAAGITVLCGKALPTAQAAALAKEKRLTLLHCSDSRGILMF